MKMLQLLVTFVALAVISATMLARAHDLGLRSGVKWNTRRVGFILAGFAPVGVMLFSITGRDPTFFWMLFSVGVCLVFVTTPYLPPWWKWISGQDETPPHEADDRRGMPRDHRGLK